MRRSYIVGMVAIGGLLLTVAGSGVSQAKTTPTPRLGISSVQYDSLGGAVPAIVTVYNPPSGYKVAITASATGGGKVTCSGAVWRNPIRRTVSRTCYLQMPVKAGKYLIHGTAKLTKGSKTRKVSGTISRPVIADGKTSKTPMSMAEIHRIERCYNTTDDVWLTFDDGGNKTQIRTILTTLKRNNVKAYFFFRGDWARENPALFKQIKAAGHIIGNHTSTHPALSRMGTVNLGKQIDQGTAATGTPKLLRPPFGAGAFTTRLQAVATDKNYRLCRWTTDSYDWEGPSAARMVERIKYGDSRSAPIKAGGVILMHGHGKHTSSGLQKIIDVVRAKKLTLPRLS
jgi:peptidoglycan/xylan/chitin deacetylase (PgdA/CDA1 family)